MLACCAVGRQPGRVLLWTVVYCLSCSFLSQPHEESLHLLVTAAALPARALVCEEMGYFFPYLDAGVIAALSYLAINTQRRAYVKLPLPCFMLVYVVGPGP